MESDPANIVSSSDGLGQGLKKLLDLHGRTTGPTRRSTKGQWTAEEDDMLCQAVQRFKGKNWKKIAECFKDRTDVQCLHRWQKVLNPELVKGPWTKEEDEELIQLVKEYGPKKWSTIALRLNGRIGKQCRERWHNHLNPAINKKAWTQEEELMLIQAHRVYGNKWAELTKFLPGRTDNAIKNHWNSSVKKKLDAYLASGLLSQFQGLPCVSQSTPTTSSRTQTQQCSGGGGDVGEISECSQGSTFVRCSQSNNDTEKPIQGHQPADMANENPDDTEHDTQPPENGSENEDPVNNPCRIVDSSKFIKQSHHACENELENPSSVDLSSEAEFMLCLDVDQNNQSEIQGSVAFSVSTDVDLDKVAQMLTSEDDCPNVIQPPDGTSDSLFSKHLNSQILHADTLNSQSYCSDLVGTASYSQLLASDSNQFNSISVGAQEFNDALVYANESGNSHLFNDPDNVGAQDHKDEINGTLILPFVDENQLQTQKQETGGGVLSYEPPRFPSMDFPFLKCDLIQSAGDLQHEFSPLGIRQLMMNCFSPCRLWDSPSPDHTPQALLKSAAKTFTSTPSILKKRNRDLLSPFSDKRSDKKQERRSFLNQHLQSSSQTLDSEPFAEDKENIKPDDEMTKEGCKTSTVKVQQNLDNLFCSPHKVAIESNTPKGPHNLSEKRGNHFAASIQYAPSSSAPLEITSVNSTNENSGMFGETPLRKSLESPCAWMSPWSSFMPGPRVDTDITIEDIGYFTSPGERSYDALGLMKQLSEHTASVHANAREVLGYETPDSIIKRRFSQHREKILQESNILSERRVLDFSECGSPRQGEQSVRHSSGSSFSSPSSYLLKGCR